MGAFFLVRHGGDAGVRSLAPRLERCLERQRLGQPHAVERPEYSLRLYGKMLDTEPNLFAARDDLFAFCTGTFIYKERIGRRALELLLSDFDPDNIDWNEIYGHFCVGVNSEDTLYLFTDRIGVYKTYCDSGQRVFSSSFLAVLESIDHPHVDSQSIYEYVFRGATYGKATVIDEVRQLECDSITRLCGQVSRLPHKPLAQTCASGRSWQDLQQANLSNARRYFRIITRCFGDRVATALSAGYDSRLMLALLQEQGACPYVYVYGKRLSNDVRVAMSIANKQSFPIHHTDKDEFGAVAAGEFSEIVGRNFHVFDGYPIDGIFDNGSDLATRRERAWGGRLVLNGGGGEIYRTFFPIANGKLTASQFVRSCYNDFEASTCTPRFSPTSYRRAVAGKVRETVANGNGALSRREIERLYVDFRCRYWMGRNNSIENRFSCSLTPFIDHHIVPEALQVPLRFKLFGRFEAAMIAEISPALASFPSDRGHDFLHEPGRGRKARELAMMMYKTYFPVSMYRLKNRLSQCGRTPFPYFLRKDYLEAVMDSAFPYLREFFHVDRVTDAERFARVCTLEYLFQKYQPSIA